MRKVIEASEGKILTNGSIFGKRIYLAEDVDESTFYEITESGLEALQAEADTKDYEEAFQKLGVNSVE